MIALLMIAAAGPAFAQELSVTSAVSRLLEHDSALLRAELDVAGARYGRRSVLGGILPQVTLDSNGPLGTYGFTRRQIVDQSVFPPEGKEVDTHAVSARIGLTQALPTDGVATVSAYNTTQVAKSSGDTLYTQDLGVAATLRQPLFTNGKLIDLRVFDAAQKLAADLPLQTAETNASTTRDERVIATLDAYVQVVSLRRDIRLLGTNIETTSERVAQVRIREAQGTVTQRDVWDQELVLDELRETRLKAQYSLLGAEYALAAGIGVEEPLSDWALAEDLPDLGEPADESVSVRRAMETNPTALLARRGIEQARLQQVVNGRDFAATLTATASLSPAYPPTYRGAESLQDSYSDLFDEESSWDPSLSLALSVPLYSGGRPRYQRLQDDTRVRDAELALDEAMRSVEQSIRSLYLRRRLLTDQLALRTQALSLEKERLGEQETLATLDATTELALREAGERVTARENEVWRSRADIMLNTLRIAQATGVDVLRTLGVEQQ